ncbi:MAG: hypothetical protein Q9217_005054 [Psora testacea]
MEDLPFDPATLTNDKLRGVGVGLSSEVVHIAGTNIVAKIPSPRDLEEQKVEKEIYERLERHPNILKYLGQSPSACKLLRGALLFEYHRHGSLMDCFDKLKISSERSRSVHPKGVVHGDLGLHNFLLHDDGRIVLCDFAGSGLDGSLPNISAGVRYTNPLFDSDYPLEQDDVFALGTVLYELHHGERLFNGKSDQEIRQCLRKKHFPDLSMVSPPLRQVIEKRWKIPHYKASDALNELGPLPSSSRNILPARSFGLAIGAVFVLVLTYAIKGDHVGKARGSIAVALIPLLVFPSLLAIGFGSKRLLVFTRHALCS